MTQLTTQAHKQLESPDHVLNVALDHAIADAEQSSTAELLARRSVIDVNNGRSARPAMMTAALMNPEVTRRVGREILGGSLPGRTLAEYHDGEPDLVAGPNDDFAELVAKRIRDSVNDKDGFISTTENVGDRDTAPYAGWEQERYSVTIDVTKASIVEREPITIFDVERFPLNLNMRLMHVLPALGGRLVATYYVEVTNG